MQKETKTRIITETSPTHVRLNSEDGPTEIGQNTEIKRSKIR